MKSIPIQLGSIMILLLSALCSAQQNTRIHLNTDKFNRLSYVPSEVIIDGKGEVPAPIGMVNKSPIVKVFINQVGPFYFLLDTGSYSTLFSKHLVNRLKLPFVKSETHKIATVSQITSVKRDVHIVNEMKLGDVVLKNFAVHVKAGEGTDLEIFKRRGPVGEAGIDGLLGMNAFYGALMTIDYKNERIRFENRSLSKDDPHSLPYGIQSFISPNISLSLNFNKLKRMVQQNFVLDTGASIYIHVNACDIPEMFKFTGIEKFEVKGVEGKKRLEYFARLHGALHIYPDYSIHAPYITFSQVNCHAKRQNGLLGHKFFQEHQVSIDIDDRLIKITPNHSPKRTH